MTDKYLLISLECLSSLGNSLELETMLQKFLRTITKKTSAIAGMVCHQKNLEAIVKINKKSLSFDINQFPINTQKEYFEFTTLSSEYTLLKLVYKDVIFFLKYSNTVKDLHKIAAILLSMSEKINASVEACKIFDEYKRVKDRMELAIMGANDGLWDWNIEEDTVYFSPRWKSMIGYQDHELKNEYIQWEQRIHPDDKENALKNIELYLEKKIDVYEQIHRLQHKDGHYIWILVRGKGLWEKGKLIQMVGFHTDISKQKQLEEKLASEVQKEVSKNKKKDDMLRQQSRLAQLGEMISMIAHQWRQPLAAIASISVALKLKIILRNFDFETEEGIEDFLEIINDELQDVEELVNLLTNTIDDFRNFYKPDKESKLENLSIPIKKSLAIITPQLTENSVNIVLYFKSEQNVRIFENEILQVFLNIFKNSLDNFQEKKIENREIIIVIKDVGNTVEVTITDNGGGIPSQFLDKIFDPYFSTKDAKNGTGLGLYMSKMIIEQHHKGVLSAHNTHDGVEFTIRLPHPL